MRGTWRLTTREKEKYLAAERLGLTQCLLEGGWPSLSAKDAGRIGGSMRGKRSSSKGRRE